MGAEKFFVFVQVVLESTCKTIDVVAYDNRWVAFLNGGGGCFALIVFNEELVHRNRVVLFLVFKRVAVCVVLVVNG